MAKPGVPPYGKHGFRLEQRRGEEVSCWAPRAYVLKANPAIYVRSTRDSKHWAVIVAASDGVFFPYPKTVSTLFEAIVQAVKFSDLLS
jgi:hypothetical protein